MDPTRKIGNTEKNPQIIDVVYAGGTISSMTTSEGHREGGHAQDLVELLHEHSPELELDIELGEKQFAYTCLSENLTHKDQELLAEMVGQGLENNTHGVFVSHGTDSLEQTARLLDQQFGSQLNQSGKKVIITAANEDLEHPETDAWDNLQFALESFSSDAPAGVYVAFHGKLIPASEVVKMPYNYQQEATFVSSLDPEYEMAFSQQAEDDAVKIAALQEVLGTPVTVSDVIQYDVNVIRDNHEELINYVTEHNVSAVLLNLYHSGSANTATPGQSVVELVKKLREENGVVFFGVTENGEPTNLHKYETSVKLREAGVVPLYNMSKAVAKKKLEIFADEDPDVMVAKMLNNQVGEIDRSLIIEADVLDLIDLYTTSV